jgi:hypothetical protein
MSNTKMYVDDNGDDDDDEDDDDAVYDYAVQK